MKGFLMLLSSAGRIVLPDDREEMYKMFHSGVYLEMNYFPVDVKRELGRLRKKGLVKIEEVEKGSLIELTELGRNRVWLDCLESTKSKQSKWDGKWRVVFFDVGDKKREVRNKFRKYLGVLGYMKYQESVYISQYDNREEIMKLREIFGLDSEVRLGVLGEIENGDDFKHKFNG